MFEAFLGAVLGTMITLALTWLGMVPRDWSLWVAFGLGALLTLIILWFTRETKV